LSFAQDVSGGRLPCSVAFIDVPGAPAPEVRVYQLATSSGGVDVWGSFTKGVAHNAVLQAHTTAREPVDGWLGTNRDQDHICWDAGAILQLDCSHGSAVALLLVADETMDPDPVRKRTPWWLAGASPAPDSSAQWSLQTDRQWLDDFDLQTQLVGCRGYF